MPFGIHKHSNRSKASLSVVQGSLTSPTVPSGSGSPVAAPDETRTSQAQHPSFLLPQQPQPSHDTSPSPSYPPLPTSPLPASEKIDSRGYLISTVDAPAPSQSTHYSNSQLVPPADSSADDLVVDARKLQPPGRTNTVPVAELPKKSKSLFDRMRAGASRSSEQKAAPAASSYNNTTGLARRLSKRSETPPVLRTVQQRNSLEQQWQADQRSQFLPSPQEGTEDDHGLDPFLITDPEEEEVNNSSHSQGQHTIRAVPNDSRSYSGDDNVRQQYLGQHQHSSSQVYHQHPEQAQQGPYQISSQGLGLTVGSLTGSPGLSEQFRPQSSETISQLSYESLVEEPQPIPAPNGQSQPSYNPQQHEHPSRSSSIPVPRPLSQYTGMAPPPGTAQQNRRSVDPKQALQNAPPQEQRDGQPPGYRQQFPGPPTPAGPPPNPSTSQGPNYQGGPPQRGQYSSSGDQGRSTPPPASGERDINEAFKEILTKYKKVKGLYFEKTAQVEQLQNTLANQRLSQSRTSLDDSEYMTRFQRLDGATTNLAFNIRKDWRSIPPWLTPYVNHDALKIGKQEMTAVGRACITRFLVDEIFNRTFHPGLESSLSTNLKYIEQNIRRFSPTINNQEESEALTAKVVQWRLATLDGLRDVLSHPDSDIHKKEFTQVATSNLTASLINFLQEPIPAGIPESAHMIVELAVSIAANLPLESRDIHIVYPLPGDTLLPYVMKVEQGIPALENPGVLPEPGVDADTSSTGSAEREENGKDTVEGKPDSKNRREKAKSTAGMLHAMIGGNSNSSTGAGQKKHSVSSQGGQEGSAGGSAGGGEKKSAEGDAQKVRFAGFVGVEVRGRQILGKAPVWTVG